MDNTRGEYREPLISGGEMIVTMNGLTIKYYFSGPDLRHNGKSVEIKGNEVQAYIDAFISSYKKYEILLDTIPPDGEFKTKCEKNIFIFIGKYRKGISLAESFYHLFNNSYFPINDVGKLNQVVADYKYAMEKSIKIKNLLFE